MGQVLKRLPQAVTCKGTVHWSFGALGLEEPDEGKGSEGVDKVEEAEVAEGTPEE